MVGAGSRRQRATRCQRAKLTAKPCPRRHRPEEMRAFNFGEIVTADHIIINEDDAGLRGERTALVIKDRGTKWMECHPLPDKSASVAIQALSHFEGGKSVVEKFYSDNAPELISAAEHMGWTHETATPGRPATNGVAERAVRSVLEGSHATLSHAGLGEH